MEALNNRLPVRPPPCSRRRRRSCDRAARCRRRRRRHAGRGAVRPPYQVSMFLFGTMIITGSFGSVRGYRIPHTPDPTVIVCRLWRMWASTTVARTTAGIEAPAGKAPTRRSPARRLKAAVAPAQRPDQRAVRTQGSDRAGSYHPSTFKLGTRLNSSTSRVASVRAPASAIEAIIRSFAPIGWPSRRSWAPIVP